MQCEIIRSRRKTLAMQWLKPDLLRVRAPYRCTDAEIQRFITDNQAWINKQQQYHRDYPGLPTPVYQDGHEVWLLGIAYRINVIHGSHNSVELLDDVLQVSVKRLNLPTVERQIKAWLRQFSELYFAERLAECHASAPLELPPYQFRIRQMKRQWGNCSRRGEIKLNLSLIQYPTHCIDYVIWHELVHLKHFHHGAAFYNLLEQCCPEWQPAKLDLEQFSG